MKRIYLQYPNSQVRGVLVAGTDTVGKVMSRYPFQEDTGASQKLVYGDRSLEAHQTFSEIGIQDEDCLSWMCEVRGNRYFPFNSLDNPVKQEFTPVPLWRAVSQGISFQSKCRNPKCSAYNQVVFVSKGFGTFNILTLSLKCPECQTQAESASNSGYCDAKVRYTGTTAEGEDKAYSDVASDGKYHTFQEEGDLSRWRVLQVRVETLD